MLSAVWMHLAPADRPRALCKLVTLLKPGGLLVMTLRHGPAEPERGMHPVTLAELEGLARDHGLSLMRTEEGSDAQGRAGITWTHVALRLPDDGTCALPLLRHVILNDAKARPTSSACCGPCAGSQMAQPDWHTMQTKRTWPCRLGSWR